LSENKIGVKGIKYLNEAMKINRTIIYLNLDNNKIDNNSDILCGMKHLSENN